VFPGNVQFANPSPSNCTFLSYNNTITQVGHPAPVFPPGAIPMGPCGKGQMTFYTGVQNGVCSYGFIPANMTIAGINTAVFNDSVACGDCYLLTGPLGSVVVTVTDECSLPQWCGGDHVHFNVDQLAFNLITSDTYYTNISYQRVSCPASGSGKIQYTLTTGSGLYYMSLVVRFQKVGIYRLDISQNGGDWITLLKSNYGPYVCDTCFGGAAFNPPIAIRMWGETGEVLIDNVGLTATAQWPSAISLGVNSIYNSQVQFQDPCPSNCLGQTMGNPTCFGGQTTIYTAKPPPTKGPNGSGMNVVSLPVFFIALWLSFRF